MTAKEIETVQILLQKLIELKARNLYGDYVDSPMPIYDGVGSPEKYSSSKIKVMWVLKEAYDDFDEFGAPKGGGWEVYEQWGDESKLKEVTSVRSWQPIMYVLRALFEDKNWDDIAWIRDEREEYVEALRSCAYININKMPAGKTSGDLSESFNIWCDVINAQILAYAPDVIIFGNTMSYFQDQSYMNKYERTEYHDLEGVAPAGIATIGNKRTLLINAYHPNQKSITRQEYVDSILAAIRLHYDKLEMR